jgi:hypothetical protein
MSLVLPMLLGTFPDGRWLRLSGRKRRKRRQVTRSKRPCGQPFLALALSSGRDLQDGAALALALAGAGNSQPQRFFQGDCDAADRHSLRARVSRGLSGFTLALYPVYVRGEAYLSNVWKDADPDILVLIAAKS